LTTPRREPINPIELIHNLWHRDKEISIDRLEQYGIDIQKLNSIDSEELVGINQFFKRLSFIDFDLENEKVKGVYERFLKEFKGDNISIRSWIFLWLRAVMELKIDDVRGGKITVIGPGE